MATPQTKSSPELLEVKPEPEKYHPLDFYTLGKIKQPPQYTTFFEPNKGFKSTSNDLLMRNIFSINNHTFDKYRENYKKPATINSQNVAENNYMKPIDNFKTYQKFNLPTHLTNKETYNIHKEKLFATDKISTITPGENLTKKNFIESKQKLISDPNYKRPFSLSQKLEEATDPKTGIKTAKLLKDNKLVFINNHRNKGPSFEGSSTQNKTKISKDAPEWFNVVPEWKVKQFNDYIKKNEDTISIFSRYQNWITVDPKNMDRRHPLEKLKVNQMVQTSKIMPKWMELTHTKCGKSPENLKSVEYYPIKQKCKKQMLWVDKNLNVDRNKYNPERSIFSYMDFRNNVVTKEQAEYYGSLVSQMPKKFFDWDDGKRFNPKFKKDV
jgi:hypothetical protein